MKKHFLILFILSIATGCQTKERTIPIEVSDPPEYIQSHDDIVDMHGDITNLERFYLFVDHIEQVQKDKIRIVNYTTEGAPMLHDLEFDGTEIHSTYDSTRDGYGSGSIEEVYCKGIIKVKRDSRTDYVLEECSNQKEDVVILVIED
ncbi:DUF4362 domain-containing protein [Mesobacillus subterraneus]|uniref:DUF4362 domain-containing protein n=1 Tax=Mesobacillus subterraneus TaxID=285983 RepID=UPI001CFE3063|nr:DUF4362 domain-containing protein [Mesobacillus subterraneus]